MNILMMIMYEFQTIYVEVYSDTKNISDSCNGFLEKLGAKVLTI